jgi:hypothetical protein
MKIQIKKAAAITGAVGLTAADSAKLLEMARQYTEAAACSPCCLCKQPSHQTGFYFPDKATCYRLGSRPGMSRASMYRICNACMALPDATEQVNAMFLRHREVKWVSIEVTANQLSLDSPNPRATTEFEGLKYLGSHSHSHSHELEADKV